MGILAHYSPEDVSILVAGLLQIDGLIDGSFITISKDVMPFRSVKTTDGIRARIYDNDQSYTITLTLASTSDSNDFLTKLWQIDELSQMGKFPLLIKDGLGSSLFFSATSWIEGIPDTEYSNDITARTWVIKCSQAVINIGGNSEASGVIQDLFNIVSSALPGLEGLL